MPVSFRIIPQRGLVFVRYTGLAGVAETFDAFAAYAAHPDFRPGQKQLLDLAGVTGVERDHAGLMALQARMADVFVGHGVQTLLVFHAPTRLALEMAQMALKSWEASDDFVPTVQQSERDALRFLGLRERRFDDLLQLVR